jgi:hypothetical protein
MIKRKIVLVVDRSGSTRSIKGPMESGITEFLGIQAADEDAETVVTLHDFDDEFRVVYVDKPVIDVPRYVLEPRGMTALRDAVGKAVGTEKEVLKATPEEERPDEVVLVIATDGYENSSREYSWEQISDMLAKLQRESRGKEKIHKRGWKVVYLGANQNAVAVGMRMGIPQTSSVTYGTAGTESVYASASNAILRSAGRKSVVFTDDERTDALG